MTIEEINQIYKQKRDGPKSFLVFTTLHSKIFKSNRCFDRLLAKQQRHLEVKIAMSNIEEKALLS